ncbi:MAG: FAD-binding oxidoreductase [Gammaproteobacteria bacterium]|nr:FAD-binding oxidoreductase [Gammaproteobacteria bacterium]
MSDRSPVTFRDELPESADAVVVGGGVIGISTAWFLAQRGVDVLVLEKGRVAGEQSSRNWGWIRKQGRDADELPIMMESQEIWAGLAEEIGEDVGFARRGVAYLADTDEELDRHAQWLEVAERHQLDTRVLTGPEVDALIQGPPGRYAGALYTPSDARAEPFVAVPALARAVQRAGGRIVEDCAVRGIEFQRGAVSGVITERGRVRTNAAVCAGGAWSSVLLRHLGLDLPQLTVRATAARTEPGPDIFDGAAAAPGLGFRRRADGGYTVAFPGTNEHFIGLDSFRYLPRYARTLAGSARGIRLRFDDDLPGRLTPQRWTDDQESPFERARVLNPRPSGQALLRTRESLAARLPALDRLRFVEAWAGMIDVTPDVVPVMDEVESRRGLFVATGFSGHGFGIGPGAGKVMANLVLGESPGYDLSRFRFSRFSDGTPMRPGPGL